MTKKTLFAAGAATALIALAGCGSSGQGTSGSASSAATTSAPASTAPAAPGGSSGAAAPTGATEIVMITIKDFKYEGPDSVGPGAKVVVMNEDAVNHTVTAEKKSDFDVTVEAGSTATFTAPTTPGTYKYICTFHPNMMGTLVVK